MDGWRIAEVVLVSVMVGALLPVLFQLHSTLRSAQQFFERTGPRLDRTLDGAAATIEHLQGSMRWVSLLGAALGPAVGAAVTAFRTPAPNSAASSVPETVTPKVPPRSP